MPARGREKASRADAAPDAPRYNTARAVCQSPLRTPSDGFVEQAADQRLSDAGDRMAILKIARMGHPVLYQRAAPVPDPTSPEIRQLVADMIETMHDAGGAGLAAPQVHVPLRLFVFRVLEGRTSGDPLDWTVGDSVVINPEVAALGDDVRLRWEGCLSIPGMRGAVPRAWRIAYSGVDTEGRPVDAEATGFHAGVVQHEYDHLDGILYPMRMKDFTLFGFNEELARAAGGPS
jgi:peptide deformylase